MALSLQIPTGSSMKANPFWSTYLNLPLTPDSDLASASQVGDHGNGKYVEQWQQDLQSDPQGASDSPPSTELVTGAGTKFRRISGPDPLDAALRALPGQINSHTRKDVSIARSLRLASANTAGRDPKRFFPVDALYRIITAERVKEDLETSGEILSNRINDVVSEILKPVECFGKTTSRLKIFAILALIDKIPAITNFINGKIFDVHLPLERRYIPGTESWYVRNQQIGGHLDGLSDAVKIFHDWKDSEIDAFMSMQFEVCIPVFWLSTDEKPLAEVPRWIMQSETVFPFVEDDETKQKTGGFGDVWRVKFHPAHINPYKSLRTKSGHGQSFAVKRLRSQGGNYSNHLSAEAAEGERFRKEFTALNRFTSLDHPHLIKLLCTYLWRGEYYFLFPWADGNLKDLWETHAQPLAVQQDVPTAQWFSEQLLGLVKGLKDIHNDRSAINDTRVATNPGHSSLAPHGKHGDLTPQNILFFNRVRDVSGPRSAQFKISDFGVAEFHRSVSLQVDANKQAVVVTPTYRAPECDTTRELSPQYDIWSLGCILLECIAWYLGGWEGVSKFSKRRSGHDLFYGPYLVDNFFKVMEVTVKSQDNSGSGDSINVAVRKRAVTEEFAQLSNHRDCSGFLLELLEYIDDHILRMEPSERAPCNDIAAAFEQFHAKCLRDHDYCTKKLDIPPTRIRTNSSLLVGGKTELTTDVKMQIRQTIADMKDDESQKICITATKTTSPTGGESATKVRSFGDRRSPPGSPRRPLSQPQVSLILEESFDQQCSSDPNNDISDNEFPSLDALNSGSLQHSATTSYSNAPSHGRSVGALSVRAPAGQEYDRQAVQESQRIERITVNVFDSNQAPARRNHGFGNTTPRQIPPRLQTLGYSGRDVDSRGRWRDRIAKFFRELLYPRTRR